MIKAIKRKPMRAVKMYEDGGPVTLTAEQQVQKADEARQFLKLLYGDQRVRDIINRNLRFDSTPSLTQDEYGNDVLSTPSTRDFINNPPDISVDTPGFLIPFASNVVQGQVTGDTVKDDRGFSIRRQDLGLGSISQKLIDNFSMMYPDRVDELATRAGVANLYADLMGDFSASMLNMDTASDEEGTKGSVARDPRAGMRDDGSGGRTYIARDMSLGKQQKPLTMGLGKFQRRANTSVQMDADAPMQTYIHELTHAGDLEANDFNRSFIQDRAHVYTGNPDGNERDKNLKQTARLYGYGNFPEKLAEYISEPTETLARLNELRYAMYKHFDSPESGYKGEDFVNYTYGQVPTRDLAILSDPRSKEVLRELRAVYTDDDIFEMLNNVY